MRIFFWEAYSILAGFICFILPAAIYGYGVANDTGKTDDLYTVAIATYQAVVMCHHLQLFTTIRNYSTFYAFTCPLSVLWLWPILLICANYGVFGEEVLYLRLGEIIFDQFFYQFSSILLSVALVIVPIYVAKVVKMRILYPHFFPID